MGANIKLIYHAAKVRLGFLIMACALAGVAVSPNENLTPWQILILGLATLVASSVAGAFNQIYERDLDARMKRTRKRAFVTGKLKSNGYWFSILALLLLGSVAVAALATNVEAAAYIFLGRYGEKSSLLSRYTGDENSRRERKLRYRTRATEQCLWCPLAHHRTAGGSWTGH